MVLSTCIDKGYTSICFLPVLLFYISGTKYRPMNKVQFVIVGLLLFVASCNFKHDRLKSAIEKKETALTDKAKLGEVDSVAVVELLKDYEAFAEAYPEDISSAIYLFKSADFYRYLHQPLRSIEMYRKVYERYPAFGRRPYALLLQGFVFENEVGNPHAAKAIYEKFLETYPNHHMAKDVRATLSYLGKTPEQIVAEFQANALIDSLAKVDSLKQASGK